MSLQEDLAAQQALSEAERLRIAGQIEIIARRIELEIIETLLRNGNEVPSPQVLASLYQTFQAIVDSHGGEFADQMDTAILAELKHVLAQHKLAFRAAGVASLEKLFPRQAAQAWLTFEQQIAERTILTSYEPFRQLMWDEWRDHWAEKVSRLRRRFTRAMLTGEPINSIVPDVAPELTELAVEASQDPEVFAKAFTRTKMTELHVSAAIQQGRAAYGDDARYANVGVMDTRQSQQCFEASIAGIMSLLEWEAWESTTGDGGPPPRHVLNCRCTLLALPVRMALRLVEGFRTQSSPRWERSDDGGIRRRAA